MKMMMKMKMKMKIKMMVVCVLMVVCADAQFVPAMIVPEDPSGNTMGEYAKTDPKIPGVALPLLSSQVNMNAVSPLLGTNPVRISPEAAQRGNRYGHNSDALQPTTDAPPQSTIVFLQDSSRVRGGALAQLAERLQYRMAPAPGQTEPNADKPTFVLPRTGALSPSDYTSVYSPRNQNNPIFHQHHRMTVEQTVLNARDNSQNQRPMLWMPPDAHADVGLSDD